MEELEAKEKDVVDGIDEEFRAKFEKIVRNKEGRGIVAVTCGYCTGCHLVLPQEFINKVRSNDKIYFCPNCSRTLYFKEDDGANGENIFSAFGNGDDDDDFFNAED
jgi:predicted  nucleic acid-binding Zn-ribbon protein